MPDARRSSITQEAREFVETWENIATFQNAVIRLDVRGDEKHEVISGEHREFYLTTEERMLTQAKVIDKENDPFLNGCFRPVVVPENVTIESNPNALSDQEILDIFAASDLAWGEWMKTITSPATLNRMVTLADDAPGVTVKRLREVQAQLNAVKPPTRLSSRDETLQKFMADDAQRRDTAGTGGRSSSYR